MEKQTLILCLYTAIAQIHFILFFLLKFILNYPQPMMPLTRMLLITPTVLTKERLRAELETAHSAK